MGKIIDISNQKFGRLTAIEIVGFDKRKESIWKCKCECGNEITTTSSRLRNGITKSCGCYSKDFPSHFKHGYDGTPIMRSYHSMHNRCENPNYYLFHRYGGRGIRVCDEWSGKNGSINFVNWALNNGWQKGLSLDRINNNGIYEPSNCRWATPQQQSNNSSNNRIIVIDGIAHTLAEWSRIKNIKYSTIQQRLEAGWSEYNAITKPLHRGIRGMKCTNI